MSVDILTTINQLLQSSKCNKHDKAKPEELCIYYHNTCFVFFSYPFAAMGTKDECSCTRPPLVKSYLSSLSVQWVVRFSAHSTLFSTGNAILTAAVAESRVCGGIPISSYCSPFNFPSLGQAAQQSERNGRKNDYQRNFPSCQMQKKKKKKKKRKKRNIPHSKTERSAGLSGHTVEPGGW